MPMSLRDDLDLWEKAAVCSDAFASKLDLCLHIGSHHGVDGRGTITQNSSCAVERTLRCHQQKLKAHSFIPLLTCARCHDLLGQCHRSVKMQINPVCQQDIKLNVEHDIHIHDVQQFASEVCNVFLDATWTCDVLDNPVLNVVPSSVCWSNVQ